jgi:hypothetical protein
MVLYQSPSAQIAQHLPQMASANQQASPVSPQPAPSVQPTASPLPQVTSATQMTIPTSPQQELGANQQIDWATKIAEVMRDQFGLKPKQQSLMYKTLYPTAYDYIPFPHKYKIPDFTKFLGQGDVSIVEHVNRFIMQCGEAANQDALRVRLFSMSLSGSAFTWFTTLPSNSILYWADLRKSFINSSTLVYVR